MSDPTAADAAAVKRLAEIERELERLAGWIEYARLAREAATDLMLRRYWGRKLAAYDILVSDLEHERAGLTKSD